jgi:hypothetical protein
LATGRTPVTSELREAKPLNRDPAEVDLTKPEAVREESVVEPLEATDNN